MSVFSEPGYLEINRARLEHLESILDSCVDVRGRSVLELGAGVGDLTAPFMLRGGKVTTTDARPEHVAALRERWPAALALQLDACNPAWQSASFDVVSCYGLLYHLDRPLSALSWMAESCSGVLLLETCVSRGDETQVFFFAEEAADPRNSVRGLGCRPTRSWIWETLTDLFEHVYAAVEQPAHPEFPLDWSAPPADGNVRAVFVASRSPLASPLLTAGLPTTHVIHQADPNG